MGSEAVRPTPKSLGPMGRCSTSFSRKKIQPQRLGGRSQSLEWSNVRFVGDARKKPTIQAPAPVQLSLAPAMYPCEPHLLPRFPVRDNCSTTFSKVSGGFGIEDDSEKEKGARLLIPLIFRCHFPIWLYPLGGDCTRRDRVSLLKTAISTSSRVSGTKKNNSLKLGSFLLPYRRSQGPQKGPLRPPTHTGPRYNRIRHGCRTTPSECRTKPP